MKKYINRLIPLCLLAVAMLLPLSNTNPPQVPIEKNISKAGFHFGDEYSGFSWVTTSTGADMTFIYSKKGNVVWSSKKFPELKVISVQDGECIRQKDGDLYQVYVAGDIKCWRVEGSISHPEVRAIFGEVQTLVAIEADTNQIVNAFQTEAFRQLADAIDTQLRMEEAEALKSKIQENLTDHAKKYETP